MILISLLLPYILALLFTLLIEGILCWILLKSKPWLKFTCLVNLFTNPLMNTLYTMSYWFLEKQTLSGAAPWLLLLLELAVWLSEAWLFYRFSATQDTIQATHRKAVFTIYKALLFSLTLNAVSYLIGWLLQI